MESNTGKPNSWKIVAILLGIGALIACAPLVGWYLYRPPSVTTGLSVATQSKGNEAGEVFEIEAAPAHSEKAMARAALRVAPIQVGKVPVLTSAQRIRSTGKSVVSVIRAAPIQLPTRNLSDFKVLATGDPKVCVWLDRWWSGVSKGQPVSAQQFVDLEQVLRNTTLSCNALVDLGNAINYCSGDHATGLFFAAAAIKGDQELSKLQIGSTSAAPIIATMHSMMPLLWRLPDEAHDKSFVSSIYLIDSDLARWIPPSDRELAVWLQSAQIGAAESLYLLGRVPESLSQLEQMQPSSMTAEGRNSYSWILGLDLYHVGRYAKAKSQFERLLTLDCTNFGYLPAANKLLVECYVHQGDMGHANQALDNWIRRFHPATSEVAAVLALMERGNTSDYAVNASDGALWIRK